MMKIAEQYVGYEVEVIEVIGTNYVGNYTIRIFFDDGSVKEVNFGSFLTNSNHPSIRKYLDENLFLQYKIINGNLNWNDYDMIFPISDLHQGRI